MTKPELMIKNDVPVLITCVHVGDHEDLPFAKYGLAVELDDSEQKDLREQIAAKLRAVAVLTGQDEVDEDTINEFLGDHVETAALVADPILLCWN